MDAVKAAYAPLKITLTDTEAVIENRNLFTDLNAYDLVFASSVNGKPERRAVLRQTAPGETVHLLFPFALPETGLYLHDHYRYPAGCAARNHGGL